MNSLEAFRAEMRRAGLEYSGPIMADGRLHRVKVEGDKARNSWYVLFAGPPLAGAFGCWKRNFKDNWHERNGDLSQTEWDAVRRRNKETEKILEAETEARQKKAREVADWIFRRGNRLTIHPYLTAKNVSPHGDMKEYRGAMVLPLRDTSGEFRSLQFISVDGTKRFLPGGHIAGRFFTLADKPDGPLVICEGYATGASIHEATGFATVAAMHCGNLLPVAKTLREKFPQREIILAADNDQWTEAPKKNPGLTDASAAAKAIGAKLAVPAFKDTASEPTDFNDLHQLEGMAMVRQQIEAAVIQGPADDLQRALADARPKIRLPGADRLLSDFGRELGEIVRGKDIFLRNGEVVVLADGQLRTMSPQTFRCWAEQFFIGYRAKTVGENTFEFNVTMADGEARGVLAAPQFMERLRQVRRINHARLPTFGKDGKLALFPEGYEAETGTLTLADVVYDFDLPVGDAVEMLNDLLREFCFADGERSKAVAISAMMGVFASQLVPEKSLRPCFVFVGNAEGCGKSLLTQICIVPTLGAMPIGSKANEDDEIRKALLTAIREASPVIVFDNIKGRLSSEPLEAFLSAPVWSGRKLGVNENIIGENVSTVFLTGNGMTVSPDMRRRSLFVELHLEAERAEDRIFSRLLDLPSLLELRPQMLAALWSLVKFWDMRGRPAPSRSHSAFPSWANIIGGIVEAAGFACPLATANVTAAADPDGEAMRSLVAAMAEKATPLTFGELIALAQEQGLFETIIGSNDGELDRKAKAALSRLLARYDRRLVLDWRFMAEGQGRTRRYKVESRHAGNAGHAIPADKLPLYAREPQPETP